MTDNKLHFKFIHAPILDSLRAIASMFVCILHFVVGTINFVKNEMVLGIFLVVLAGIICTILFFYSTYVLVEKRSQKYSSMIKY